MIRPNIANRSFDRMGERYAHLIDPYHFLGRSSFDIPRHGKKVPAVNLLQNGKDFVLEIAVPGFAREEIQVFLEEDVLTVRGEKHRSAQHEQDRDYVLEEFDTDSFERSFKLARSLDRKEIEARYENGVLRLTFRNLAPLEKTAQTVEVQ